jgi:protein disulfide-isomerase A6
MNKAIISLAVLAFCIGLVASEAGSAVVDLNPDNFDEYVGGGKPAFVEFFAPW